jgi:hypothetical protein
VSNMRIIAGEATDRPPIGVAVGDGMPSFPLPILGEEEEEADSMTAVNQQVKLRRG